MRRKKSEKSKPTSFYIGCGFVLGSVAEVDRLLSIAGNVLRDNRLSMSPLIFESLIFLGINRGYWNQDLVSLSMALVKRKNVDKMSIS